MSLQREQRQQLSTLLKSWKFIANAALNKEKLELKEEKWGGKAEKKNEK